MSNKLKKTIEKELKSIFKDSSFKVSVDNIYPHINDDNYLEICISGFEFCLKIQKGIEGIITNYKNNTETESHLWYAFIGLDSDIVIDKGFHDHKEAIKYAFNYRSNMLKAENTAIQEITI